MESQFTGGTAPSLRDFLVNLLLSGEGPALPAAPLPALLAGLEGAFLPLSVAAQREGLFEYTLRVAELDGTAAGFAAFTPDELAWLYVDPALARRGVGRALVEDALERMERPVSIEVLEGNGPALALYLGCGFREAGTASGQMPGNEAFSVTCHVLRLD